MEDRKLWGFSVTNLTKTGLSVLSFAVLLAYLDLPGKFFQKDSQINRKVLYGAIFCTLAALEIYFFNYFRFVCVPRLAQRITAERWITVSPGTVYSIFGAHFLAALLYVMALSPSCGVFMSLLLIGLGYWVVCDLLCYTPL
jgi:hypothetical protein